MNTSSWLPVRLVYERRLRALLLFASAAAVLSAWLVAFVPLFTSVELKALDWRFRARSRKPDPRIRIVGMDERTLQRLGRTAYPLPRSLHARLLEELCRAKARVIGLDLVFLHSSAEDETLADSMRRAGNVFIPLRSVPQPTPPGRAERAVFEEPTALLASASDGIGSILAFRPDGIIRWIRPYQEDAWTGKLQPHLSLLLATGYLGLRREAAFLDVSRLCLRFGDRAIPLGHDGEAMLSFAGPPGTYPMVPYHQVLMGEWKQRLAPDYFKDKVVLVGMDSPTEDRWDTAVGYMQGVEVLANAVGTLLRRDQPQRWTLFQNFALTLVSCLVLACVVWRWHWIFALLAACAEAAVVVVLARAVFTRSQVWFDMTEPLLGLALTFGLLVAYEGLRATALLSRFVPEEALGKLLLTGPRAATEEQEITVLFADLRNYTSLSEALPSEELEDLVNEFFSAVEAAASRYGGTIDKYVGDAAMVLFGSSGRVRRRRTPRGVHALQAVLAAFMVQEQVHAMSQRGAEGAKTRVEAGVGIATGPVRLGTVGTRHRQQYTAIGDAVNVASRLDGAAKLVGRDIVISESTFQYVSGFVEIEPLGEIPLKGKEKPVRIYAPVRLSVSEASLTGDGSSFDRAVSATRSELPPS